MRVCQPIKICARPRSARRSDFIEERKGQRKINVLSVNPRTCQCADGIEVKSLNLASNDAISDALEEDEFMRSTINIDDSLIEKARSLTGTKETAAIVRQALETLVRVEAGKRLVALGGTMPDAESAPRRQRNSAK